MNHTTILCPIDFSAATERLVAYAAALAAGTGAELRLLHVLEPQPMLPAMVSDLSIASQLANYNAMATKAGARVSTIILRGNAAQEIVAEAQRRPTDMIVIGAHGQTGLTRFLMGNTAESVVRTAPCATLLMKCRPAETLRQSA
jgi:nucleotide-binding universal stress UspA family protein